MKSGKLITKAAEFKQAEIVKMILQSGAIAEEYRWRAAVSAASVDDVQAIKLLQGKDPFDKPALRRAIYKALDYGCINSLEYLLHLKKKYQPRN